MNPQPVLHAYCWQNGQIGFGKRVPKGALSLGSGSPKALRSTVMGYARHSRTSKKVFVPGVPEASHWMEAAAAVGRMHDLIKASLKRKEAA